MRITEKDLQASINHLNKLTNSPLEYAYRDAEGKLITNPNHFHLDAAYGGYKLVRTCNEGGGVSDISKSGFTTKRALYNEIHSIISALYSLGGE